MMTPFLLGSAFGTFTIGSVGAYIISRCGSHNAESRITAMVVLMIVAIVASVELVLAYALRGA